MMMMATNLSNGDFLPHNETMIPRRQMPRQSLVAGPDTAVGPLPAVNMSSDLPQDTLNPGCLQSPADSLGTSPESPATTEEALGTGSWNLGTSSFMFPPGQDATATDSSNPTTYGRPIQSLLMAQMNPPTAIHTSNAMSAQTKYDPDLEMEFELNTDMGMVLRPSSNEHQQQHPAYQNGPGMRPGSPSDWLDIPDPSSQNIGGTMMMGIGEVSKGKPGGVREPAQGQSNYMDQTIENLDRLENDLQAATRRQMSLVSDPMGSRAY